MKILIVGLGSIGERHLQNLLRLGFKDISVFRRSGRKPRTLVGNEFKTFTDWQSAVDEKPEAVVITNPTPLHVPFAIDAAQRGAHLFIEKPLSSSLGRANELRDLIAQNHLVNLIGYNMRFHPCLQKVREIMQSGILGQPLSARAEFGQYLPDFHPWEDYRQGYAARRELGGGALFTNSHEVDYLYWLFGPVENVSCIARKLSTLEIDVEDTAALTLEHESGVLSEVHLDFIQRTYSRSLQIIGSEGTLRCDFSSNRVAYCSAGANTWTESLHMATFDVNETYIEEIAHFIRCIEGEDTPVNDIDQGIETLKISLAAHRSSAQARVIMMEEVHL